MKNKYICAFLILAFSVVLPGCKTTDDIKVRSYLQEKKRVDQEIAEGTPVGNWESAPNLVDGPRKETRQLYVVEVTQRADQVTRFSRSTDETYRGTSGNIDESLLRERRSMETGPKFNLPDFDDEVATDMNSDVPATTFVEYKVEKNDTLQKISKKFYNTHSGWPKIYEANKDKLKNPDRLSPGITIMIPME